MPAYRWAWLFMRGELPEGLSFFNVCGNRRCGAMLEVVVSRVTKEARIILPTRWYVTVARATGSGPRLPGPSSPRELGKNILLQEDM